MALLRFLSAAAFCTVLMYFLLPAVGWSPPMGVQQQQGPLGQSSFTKALDDIPSIGLGTWLSNYGEVAHATEYALSSGYDHIDAAWIYRNEDQTGKGILASGRPRESIWVTSKLWNSHHRASEAERAIRKSIADLQVGYLDLYLMHWPVAFVPEGDGGSSSTELDTHTSLVDTWRAMEDLVRANYTRRIGVSNFSRAQLAAVLAACDICPYAHELETHPYLQQQAFVDWHRTTAGLRVIAYSPLANTNPAYDGGRGKDVPSILEDPFWTGLAAAKNATVAQAVLAWGLQRGTVVIPRSVSEGHLAENLGARGVEFTDDEMRAIGEQDKKVRMCNPGKSWGVDLFDDLDDPTRLDGDQEL